MRALALFLLLAAFGSAHAQGLLDELETEAPKSKEFTIATFKAPRIIQGHSVEMPAKGELLFIIQHRFGRVNTGFYELFGWDQASIRIGLEYTLPFSDRFNIGFGRSSYGKTWDFFSKTKLLKQAKGGSPISLSWVSTLAINGLDWPNPNQENYFTSRMAYTHQLLLARKFNSWFSFQLAPTLVHKNLVPLSQDQNSFFALGMGGRVKVSNRVSINAEYSWLLPGQQMQYRWGWTSKPEAMFSSCTSPIPKLCLTLAASLKPPAGLNWATSTWASTSPAPSRSSGTKSQSAEFQ